MPIQTVAKRNDDTHVALCSCGWTGEPRAAKDDAYHDKAKHKKEGCK